MFRILVSDRDVLVSVVRVADRLVVRMREVVRREMIVGIVVFVHVVGRTAAQARERTRALERCAVGHMCRSRWFREDQHTRCAGCDYLCAFVLAWWRLRRESWRRSRRVSVRPSDGDNLCCRAAVSVERAGLVAR